MRQGLDSRIKGVLPEIGRSKEDIYVLATTVVERYRKNNPPTYHEPASRKPEPLYFKIISLAVLLVIVAYLIANIYYFSIVIVLTIVTCYLIYTSPGVSTQHPEINSWDNKDIISDEDILVLSDNKHIKDWLLKSLEKNEKLTYTFLFESIGNIRQNAWEEALKVENNRLKQLIESPRVNAEV
jgi:hypothetical protein